MSSIIEGYNYDIFISYRQKDNKHDGWVTEFVDNLKGELESTFKQEVSVYFDINPHTKLNNHHYLDCKGLGLYKQSKYEEALKIIEKSRALRLIYRHITYRHLEEAKKAIANQKKN